MKSERIELGRSMVEMLGVLPLLGVVHCRHSRL